MTIEQVMILLAELIRNKKKDTRPKPEEITSGKPVLVICPSCRGSGRNSYYSNIACPHCKGAGRVYLG